MQDLVHKWRHEILPRLTFEQAFSGVEWRSRHGREWRTACPIHGGDRDSLAANVETLGWKCHACGKAGGPLEWRNGGEPVRGPRFGELVCELAREVGVDLEGPIDYADMFRFRPQQQKKTKPRMDWREATRWWNGLLPVTEDAACGVISQRHEPCSPEEVARRDLARVIPLGSASPDWARCDGLDWCAWYSLVIPLHDERGHVAGFKGRATRILPPRAQKSASPAGYTSKGLVMADGAARWLLAEGAFPEGVKIPYTVQIVEGDYDFLGAACTADNTAAATFGVFAGCWTPTIASRIPDGTRVIVRMDNDDAGRRYAREIVKSFGTKPVQIEVKW